MKIAKFILAGAVSLILFSCERQNVSKENCEELKKAQKNKEIVLNFYQQMFGDKDLSAVDKYVAKDYIQHNPEVADGAEAFKKAAETWFKGAKKEKIDVQRIAAEGDLVFIHIKNINLDGSLKSTIDIFKLKNGKIIEHWDAQENVPQKAANSHPMF